MELKNDYLPLSCLKSNENGETYLLQSKKTTEKYILKRRPIRYKYRVNAEAQALNALANKGIPAPKTIPVEDKNDSCFLLREYVHGETLEERLQEKGGFSEAELIAIGSEICKQLSVLHNQESPIIHRDIKPQNIVITENNEIQLIDFDAARTFNEEKAHDTHFYGTEQTAAPEQYGFDQSDARTDIFGLAKTLIYLACGSYDVNRLITLSFSREFVSLMNRSVSLLKKERPASAEEFKRVLERCKGSKTRFVKRSLIITVSVFIVLTAVIFGINFINNKASKEVEFTSTLLENAVRYSLGYDESKPIYREDLERVIELKIIGSAVITRETDGEYNYLMNDTINYNCPEEFTTVGDIEDISILSYMPNLRVLYLCNQKIRDISPLEELSLSTVSLTGNSINDFFCFSDMPSLRRLYIGGNPTVSLEFMRDNKTLELLNLGNDVIDSLKPLETTAITELWFMNCKLTDDSFESISRIRSLGLLSMWEITDNQMLALRNNNSIQELNLWGDAGARDLVNFGEMKSLRVLNMGASQFTSLNGIEGFPELQTLILAGAIEDYAPLLSNTRLQTVNICNCLSVDYDTLLSHPTLKSIYCTQKQKQEMLMIAKDNHIVLDVL